MNKRHKMAAYNTNNLKTHGLKLITILAISASLWGCATTAPTESTSSLTVKKDNTLAAFLSGKQQYALGNYEVAEKSLQLAVTDRNMLAEAHLLLGNIYFRNNRFNESATQYQLALSKDPQNLKVNNNLLMLHLRETTRGAERMKDLSQDSITQLKTQNLLNAIEDYLATDSSANPSLASNSISVNSDKLNAQAPQQEVQIAKVTQSNKQNLTQINTANPEASDNSDSRNDTTQIVAIEAPKEQTSIKTIISPRVDSKPPVAQSPTVEPATEATIESVPLPQPEKLTIKLKPADKRLLKTETPTAEPTNAISNETAATLPNAETNSYYLVKRGDSLSSIVEAHQFIGGNFYQRLQAFANVNSATLQKGIKSYVEVGNQLKIPSVTEVEAMPATREAYEPTVQQPTTQQPAEQDIINEAVTPEPLKNDADAAETLETSEPSVDNTSPNDEMVADTATASLTAPDYTEPTEPAQNPSVSEPSSTSIAESTVVETADKQLAANQSFDSQALIEKKQELARLINEYKTKLSNSQSKRQDLLETIEEKSKALQDVTAQ